MRTRPPCAIRDALTPGMNSDAIERFGPEITPQTLGTFGPGVRRKRHEDGTYDRQIRRIAERVEVVSKPITGRPAL